MQEFYFQVMILVCATSATAFIGWLSINTWKASSKFASIEEKIQNIAEDIKAMRTSETQIAVFHVSVNGLDRRVTDLEHTHRAA